MGLVDLWSTSIYLEFLKAFAVLTLDPGCALVHESNVKI